MKFVASFFVRMVLGRGKGSAGNWSCCLVFLLASAVRKVESLAPEVEHL
ncbi:hypothetical protein ACTHOQ_04295 [Solibacillus silvestris]